MSLGIKMVNGDAVVTNTLEMVEGDEMLRQTVELVLSTFKGEWAFDPGEGIDREAILTKKYDEEEIRGTIEDAVLRINNTLAVTDFEMTVDAYRHASIAFKILKPGGDTVEVAYTYGD